MARDIVARLALNAQQFSSSNAAAFAELEQRARDTATRTQTAFESSFSEIQRIASRALTMQPTATGSLDLGVEEYRAAAAAAQVHAAALREIAAAAEVAALKTNDTSENTRIYVQAARAAAIEAENNARETLQQAEAMEVLQNELNQTKSAALQLNQAQDTVTRGSRAGGQAAIQASQQFQDFFIQVGSGQSVLVAGTQQLSQLAFVMQHAQGAAGKFATFLSGPWGVAILAATTLTGLLAGKLFESEDASEKAAKGAKTFSDALKEQTDALLQNIKMHERRLAVIAVSNQADLDEAVRERDRAQQAAKEAQRQVDDLRGTSTTLGGEGAGSAIALSAALSKLEAAQQRLAKASAEVAEKQVAVRAAMTGVLDAAQDTSRLGKHEKALKEIERQLEQLRRAYRETGMADADYLRQRDTLLDRQAVIKKAIEDETKALREQNQEREKAAKLTNFVNPVDGPITSGFGPRRRPTAGASANHPAIDFGVPIGTAVRAPAAGTIIHIGQSAGFGNYVIVDHGAGTKSQFNHLLEAVGKEGDFVQQGQIIARSGNSGTSTGPHLDWRVSLRGKYVDPRKMQFPTSAGDAQADADTAALREQEKLLGDIAERWAEIGKTIGEQSDDLQFQVKIEELRRNGLDVEADVELALRDIRREFPELAGKTAAEVAKQFGITEQLAQVELDRLATLEKQTAEQIRANAAAKAHAEGFKALVEDAIESGEEEMKRLADLRRQQVDELADYYETAFAEGSSGIWRDFKNQGRRIIAEIAAQWTVALLNGQNASLPGILSDISAGGRGGLLGSALGSLFGSATRAGGHVGTYGSDNGETPLGWVSNVLPGDQPNPAQSSGGLGGMFGKGSPQLTGMAMMGGQLIGSLIGSDQGAMIGSTLGGFAFGPIGGLVGGIAGGLIGSMLKTTKKGSATIGFDEAGDLGVVSTRGNSAKRIGAASDAADQVVDALQRIAEALGGELSGTPSVSIALRENKWRVDTTGAGNTKLKYAGVQDFGEDSEAAVRAAIIDALQDGVIGGISEAAKRILQAGKDLDAAIEKALLIESIPKLLKQRLDPLGAAIDELNERWEDVWDALKEGAASAEQMAEAQQLYNLELADVKEQFSEISAQTQRTAESLKDFLASLAFGPSSPLSLRDQETAARASLQPFLDKIYTGQQIDQQAFVAASQAFLSIERQLYGSTQQFFAAMDMIQAATNMAIDKIEGVEPISTPGEAAALQTAANTQATAEIAAQQRDEIVTLRQEIQGLRADLAAATLSGFIGETRAYA